MSDSLSPKANTISRMVKIFILFVVASLLLIVALLPAIVSSAWGKNRIVEYANHEIPGKVDIQSLSLSWLGPQKIRGVALKDPDDQTVLTLESAVIDSSLFKIIFDPSHINTFAFEAFNATVITDNDGNTNLMRAILKECCPPHMTEGAAPVKAVLKNVNGEVKVSAASPFTLKLTGETEQGQVHGKFDVDAELNGFTLAQLVSSNKDLSELFRTNPDAELRAHANITNFPVELLDQVVALKFPDKAGLLVDALGPQLNLTVGQKAIPKGFSLIFEANSLTMKASADVSVTKDITIATPAKVSFKITPDIMDAFFSTMPKEKVWKIANETTAELTINKLTLPLNALTQRLDKLDAQSVTLEAALDVGNANLTNEALNVNIAVNGAHAEVVADAGNPEAAVSLRANATNNQQPMRLDINVTVPKELFWQDLTHLNLKDILVNGKISGAPLFVLGEDTRMARFIADMTGPSADLTFSLKASGNAPIAHLSFSSERLVVPDIRLQIDKKITLLQPVQIVAKIPPSQVNQLLKKGSIRLQSPVTVQLDLKSLSLPVDSLFDEKDSLVAFIYKTGVDANVSLSPIKLMGMPVVDNASINGISMRLDASPHSRPEINLTANIQPDGPGKLYDIIGKKADVNATASVGMGIDGMPNLSVFNMSVSSELCRAEMSGRMLEGNRVVLNNPALISYTLTSAGLNTMGLTADNFHFTHSAPVELTIDKSHIPLNLDDLNLLRLSGKIKLNDLQVSPKGHSSAAQAALDNLVANWSINAAANRIDLDFSGITLLGEQAAAGKLNGSVVIAGWLNDGILNFDNADIRVNTVASNLPTQFLSTFSQNHDFVSVLGNAMNVDLDANISMDPTSKGSVDIALSSDNLNGSVALALGEVVTLSNKRPSEFKLKLTPDSYGALRRMIRGNAVSDFALTDTANATFKLTSLQLPVGKSILQGGVDGFYTVEHLAGEDSRTRNRLSIDSMNGKFASKNISEHVNFDMKAKGHTQQGSPTAWTLVGALDNGFTRDGSINRDALSLQLDADIETVPISLLCQFVCVDPSFKNKLEALIGPTLTAKVKAQLQKMNGPLYIDLKGSNGHLNIDAMLNSGYLTLNSPLTAQVTVTPQLSRYVLSDLIPVVSGMINADHPIKLTIDPQGFYFPVKDPSASNVAVGKATLDMGRVRFSGSSQLAKILSLLTPANADQFMVWLTPAYFSLNQGVLKLERVDMLISDNYPIAAWGTVDLARERVNMMIGLSGAAIQRAFSVSGLPNSYFMQIPLRGKLDNPSFDKTKAAAKLSAIVAQTQGGPQGMVIGTVIDIASGGLTEPPPPPPTTNPLPWAELMKDDESQKKPIEKQIMAPIEEVGKGAQNLLKKIFK